MLTPCSIDAAFGYFDKNDKDVYTNESNNASNNTVQTQMSELIASTQVQSGIDAVPTNKNIISETVINSGGSNLDNQKDGKILPREMTKEKKVEIERKIIQYRLYLEQLSNERNYVQSQLRIFSKQLETLNNKNLSVGEQPVMQNNPLGTGLQPAYKKEPLNFLHYSNNMESNMISLLFYLFLILFGYLLCYRLTNKK
tara:strand:+ start:1147 stop:1740 length:594 start_codon:yes stop_codon:yes gene_type:complete